ncbi:hypothetical protein [Alcaligenes faecalis]|uniref:Uncharacterized protein n=1 Tax=Alcaligenes faecalis TaxID=511 RepID=A0AAE9H8M5_ALCFA|nr:hypothetical protein [Alcaligenes faecalis]UPL21789.1 hypothetical protein MXF72_01540 [Alcaligenes faecalis]
MSMSPVVSSELGQECSESKQMQHIKKENCLLLDQLQVVQEELCRLYESPQGVGRGLTQIVINVAPVDLRLVESQAEAARLGCMLKMQTQLHDLKTQHALAAQLGDILIEGVQSTGSLISVPGRLRQAWRQSRRTQPPAVLGGKSFDKVIQAYQQGGDQQVEALLNQVSVSKNVQASAWTAVARTYMTTEPTLVATMARRAFALEPRGFRQKWLAFRLHESGDLLEAEALLALLPEDVTFTDSEARQRDRLLKQAKEVRLAQARSLSGVDAQYEDVRRQWDELAQSRNTLAGVVEQQGIQLSNARDEVQHLRQEKQEQLVIAEELRTQIQQLEEAYQERLQERKLEADQQRQLVLQEQDNTQAALKQVADLKRELEQEGLLRSQLQRESMGLQADLKRLKQTLLEKEAQAGQWFEQCVTVQGGLAEMAQQYEGLKAQLQTHHQDKEAALSQLQTLMIAHDELLVIADQRLEEVGSVLVQLEESVAESEELRGQLREAQAEKNSLASQVQELIGARDELAGLAAQRLDEVHSLQSQAQAIAQQLDEARQQIHVERTDYKSLQAQLNQAVQVRDEHIALATQRQGELLQQAKEQLSLEKSKAALEVRQLELQQSLAAQIARETDLLEGLSAQVQSLVARDETAPRMQEELFRKQSEELLRVRRHIETTVKNNSANAVRQIQSFVGMQEYFATGVLPAFNSEAHSWPVSADFALCLMRCLTLKSYDLVVELGSGMSTVIVAKTLALMAERNGSRLIPFVSFEHLESYYQQTLAHLQQAGLEKAVQLTLAPLEDWQAADGQVYPYYSCQSTLAKLAKQRQMSRKRILVIVDGPPAATGPQARYPAGPLFVEYFPNAQIDFLMDDYIREDEKQVAQRWLADIEAQGLAGTSTEYKLEKDACLITVHPKDSK